MASKQSKPTMSLGTYQAEPFYINIRVLNKEEVVAKVVGEKTGMGNSIFGKAAAYAANQAITDEKITEKIGDTLVEKVTAVLSEMGIAASMERVFSKSTFVVLRIQVTDVGALQLVGKAKGAEFAAAFETLLDSLQKLGMQDTVATTIDHNIKDKINAGMIEKVGSVVPVKMAEKGMEVDCKVLTAAEQAEYFFATLKTLGSIATATAAASKDA